MIKESNKQGNFYMLFILYSLSLNKINQTGYGVVFLNELIPIFEKYWKLPKQSTADLKNALKVFSNAFCY